MLTYLEQAPQVIARIAADFPGALIAFDTYRQRTLEQQEAAVTRPPAGLRRRLPRRYRYALPLASRIAGDLATVTLFRAVSR